MSNHAKVGLLVVDIQGKLAELVSGSQAMLANTQKLIKSSQLLSIPIVVLEQNPKGLGSTHREIKQHLSGITPLEKYCFNGLNESHILQAIQESQITHWLVVGIEAHICVYQTALGLKQHGFEVEIVADCIASRQSSNADLAIANLRDKDVGITSVEMFLYQYLRTSQSPQFKAVLQMIK